MGCTPMRIEISSVSPLSTAINLVTSTDLSMLRSISLSRVSFPPSLSRRVVPSHPKAHPSFPPFSFSCSFSNIMIADDGKTPILMDLGSCLPARIHIRTRQEALTQQDIAAEHSSMPYRAPELFDVHTGQTLDEKVDIWVRLAPFVLIPRFGSSPSFCSRTLTPSFPHFPFNPPPTNRV